MTTDFEPQSLKSARRIGVLGDTHGDLQHVLIVSATMWARGVSVLLVLGDFGFVWPARGDELTKLSRRLAAKGQTMYFVDGNHEDFERLLKFPVGEDGLRWVRPNIAHAPRGFRTELSSGKTMAALGGANSVDFGHRTVGRSWWPEESITEADLMALGNDHADVLVGHDAPLNVPSLDAWLAETGHLWSVEGRQYSVAGRQMFHRGFMQVRPRLHLGGHYHLHLDAAMTYCTADGAFSSRVVILDRNSGKAISQGILDVETLGIEFFARDDTTVTELTGVEAGLWQVHTSHSVYVFDLDAQTVQRQPGADTFTHPTDRPRVLRGIKTCRVGEPGFWMLESDDYSSDNYWHSSTEVKQIERVGSPK